MLPRVNTTAPAARDPFGASFLDSLKSLGLRLERRKATIRLVVDGVNKTPSENESPELARPF